MDDADAVFPDKIAWEVGELSRVPFMAYTDPANHRTELERFFYLGARLRDVSGETRSDHHQIVDAFRSRDPEAARAIMIRHNEVTREGLVQQITSSKRIGQIAL